MNEGHQSCKDNRSTRAQKTQPNLG